MESLLAELVIAIELLTQNIHWVVVGAIAGMIIGIIPGMGGIVTLTILLPFTLGMDPPAAFALLSGAVGATTFTGSITAILINTPGTASNAATLIDGYPLTRKGRSVEAISASALASASGAIIGVAIFILMIPLVMEIALLFTQSEVFWIIMAAIVIVPLYVSKNLTIGLLSGFLGFLIAFIGTAPQTGESRFNFGSIFLYDGLGLLPVLIGLFAIAELLKLISSGQSHIVDKSLFDVSGTKIEGMKEVIKHKYLWLRCSLIGLFLGTVPGAGGTASAFIAYGHAVQSADSQEGFGEGRIEGVIAPESANDAKDAGQLFPTLGLGVPGSGSMAVFLAGLLVHGITPGPRVIVEYTDLVILIALSILVANILTSVIGLLFVNQMTKILEVPVTHLLPVIAALALSATFVVRNEFFDVFVAITFGLVGVLMIMANISRVPLLIAFVLASILEQNFHLAYSLAQGDVIDAFFTGWLNIILIFIIIIALFAPLVKD